MTNEIDQRSAIAWIIRNECAGARQEQVEHPQEARAERPEELIKRVM
ncbi:hypothetical protein [Streptomyces sp. NPDC048669]